jgi:hypothetical protein
MATARSREKRGHSGAWMNSKLLKKFQAEAKNSRSPLQRAVISKTAALRLVGHFNSEFECVAGIRSIVC